MDFRLIVLLYLQMTELSEKNLINHLANQQSHLEKRRASLTSEPDSHERKTPTQRGSAKLQRISSGAKSAKSANSLSSVEDKFSALSSLLQDRLLITEFPGRHSAVGRVDEDEEFEKEFPEDISQSGRITKEGDYDTDLEMDYDGQCDREICIINEEYQEKGINVNE